MSQMNLEEFNRWIDLQKSMGFTVRTPEAVEHIQAALKKGSTVSVEQEAGKP